MSSLRDDDEDDFDELIDADDPLDIEDDLYTEAEPPLSDLEPEELIDIAEEEEIDSDVIAPLKTAIRDLKILEAEIDSDEPIPQPTQEKIDDVNDKIGDLTRTLIDDIDTYRDNMTPNYDPDEISDNEGNENGP